MPDVRITVTDEFYQVAKLGAFCPGVRQAVADVFGFALAKISVKLDRYAPGCGSERPPVTVSVSVNEGERAPVHVTLVQAVADEVKPLADEAVSGDAGQVKVVLDLCLRKTAVQGSEKWPLIDPGTPIRTTRPNFDLQDEWTKEARANRKWGAKGKVLRHHDSHGFCYDVRHADGTEGCYDPSELKVL